MNMTDRIFADYAPLYWAAGLPVIPLRQRNKMPDITQWSTYSLRMPTESEQLIWLSSFPRGNVGLPLGPESGLCMIDIDTEDEDLVQQILSMLPPSPWKRVGKKGMALAYRFEGQKNFKLRNAEGGMILEFLGLGNQVVLPPSIHPDTGRPYTANVDLWEVMDQVPCLGEDIQDKLRAKFDKAGVSLSPGGRSGPLQIVPAGERDVQMVRWAGYLARVVLGIDRSQKWSLNEAVAQMHTWVRDFTAQVSGDSLDPEKGTAKLLEFLMKDLEKGRTMPEGWDANMPPEWKDDPRIAKLFELNESQRWSVERAAAWFAGKVAEKPEDPTWIRERVWEIIDHTAKDDHFLERDVRVLITHILGLCGKDFGFKKSDLLIAWKQSKKGGNSAEDEQESHAKIAKEALEILEQSGEIRYDHGQFWQWSGASFQPLDENDLYKHVAECVTVSPLARTHSGYSQVVHVMQNLRTGTLIQSEERGINFANGFVGEDLRVFDHDPKYGCTFTLPFNYDRELASRCNHWLAFLHSCWGNEPDFAERVMALQEMFAATLFKMAPRYQKAFLLFGRAGTGKTQVLNVLKALLPPAAIATLSPEHWNERFALTDLVGKAANICGELPESGRITGSVFKQIVEGSEIRTEFKNQDGFTFQPECAHWFASNYLPQSADTTWGFVRRWHVLDFNTVVRDGDRIENLAEQIVAEEREAIAAWALEGLRRLLDQRGYTEPACHVKQVAIMRRLNNTVQAFLEDTRSVRRGEGEIIASELYDHYTFHVRDRMGRMKPVTFERFLQMVVDLNLEVVRRTDPIGDEDYFVVGVVKQDRIAA
jgi:putative DNA primase/helicase